jgi:signal transduction histidine kinase/ActR/RegA family two-component response regulator
LRWNEQTEGRRVGERLIFDVIFQREYMRAALVVSLLSIWVLVFLFYYLNRYTRRAYFTVWTAAWLFYALWLTLGLSAPNPNPASFMMILRQWCVGISAVFLLWGSLAFLEIKVRQTLFGLFMAFLLTWSFISPQITSDPLLIQMPLFLLIGMSSIFAGVSFYRLRKRRQFVGVGLLFFGFFLWGVYLATYPLTLKYENLFSAGFLVSAVLQLFIAVSMIVLVLEEARYNNEQVLQQIKSVNSEKEALRMKILSTEEQCRSLFDQARLNTDLQKAYDELRQTQHSVMQQERLRALGQMASGIAHDINNALSPILAFSEMILKKENGLQQTSRKSLEHIHTAGEDIAQTVGRMSEFYRRREVNEQLRLLNVNRIVTQAIEMTSPRWQDIAQGQGIVIQVQTDLDPALPELYGNESELREALTNVLLNAVDALPKGGVITITTVAIALNNPGGSNKPSHIVLQVRDTGIGMDEKTRQRCLEPFFSTKRQRGGTGLGLAMVYGMMERHEGTIEVESEVGKGTLVRLIFPLRHAPTPAAVPATPARPKSAAIRILCIDDEPLLREMLKEILEFSHHKVEVADGGKTGLEAFHAAQKRGEPFDVVITDLGMPYVDGRQVAQTVKTESPKTPVIMLTGWGTMLNQKGENMSQVDAILSKPPRIEDLNETISKVVATTH